MIKPIHFRLGFNDGEDRNAQISQIMNPNYGVAVVTPTNIKPLMDHQQY